MSDYTPDEEQMRYRASLVCHQGGCNIEDRGRAAEFDRFLAKIKADAWDDGYAAGQTDYESTRINPYRKDET